VLNVIVAVLDKKWPALNWCVQTCTTDNFDHCTQLSWQLTSCHHDSINVCCTYLACCSAEISQIRLQQESP
jgi:hypothetical protein